MSHIVILGAGLGGVIMAYEMKEKMRPEDELTVINLGSTDSFVPSNPWVAIGSRIREVFSAQSPSRQGGNTLREPRSRPAWHQEAQGAPR